MSKKYLGQLFLLILFYPVLCPIIYAQYQPNYNAAEIYHQLKKLNTVGKVLYLAAHPDDENQRIITYFENEVGVDAAYLSLTRGDGGQNLVGPEIQESLGIIRTQELLGARAVDGGEQFFSRANDFGYSKSVDETLEVWDKGKILSDVVYVIRKFRPDIIITRFPPDERAGHGHHTSSAVLAKASFDITGNPEMYPEQLKYVDPWQPKRIFINTGRWWNNTISEDTPGVVTIDAGKYNSLLGESYTEIAARSRSSHKSQGFGATGSRGQQIEYLELMAGDQAERTALEGIDLTWNRIEGGNKIGEKITESMETFDIGNPQAIVEDLLEVREMIINLEDEYWKENKQKQIDQLIRNCLGLHIGFLADTHYATAGTDVSIKLEVVNRSKFAVTLEELSVGEISMNKEVRELATGENNKIVEERILHLPANMTSSQPYWLKKKGTYGTYNVSDQLLIGTPENKPAVSATATVVIAGKKLKLKVPLMYHWNDPVKGEQYKPFVILPPVTVNVAQSVYIYKDNTPKEINVVVKAFEDVSGTVSAQLPQGWNSEPANANITLKKGEERGISFIVNPPSNQQVGNVIFQVKTGDDTYSQSYVEIEYDHIPAQTYLPAAEAKLVKLDVKTKGTNIGYIQGAGDDVPGALRNMGYVVEELDEENMAADILAKYDAIVLGIRALNTNERSQHYMPTLLEYTKNGGTLVIQYNTNFRLKTKEFAPYPITLSRDRVSEEDAEVTILKPDHPVLNTPNKITQGDFNGWVQERGLYFPNKWDEKYEAVLSMNDKGETPKEGSLLIAKYGEGHYVYSGLSWFRELPAGVPGAYRLLANILSLGE